MFFSDNIPWNIFKISEKTYFKVKTVFNQKIGAETFRNSQNHKKPWNSTLVPRPPKYPPKIAISHVFVRIKPNNVFFSVSLLEFQLHFTGFLKVYVTVLLLKKYLTSKIEKNVPHVFFCNFMNPLIMERRFHNLKCL